MTIRELEAADNDAWYAMRAALWPDCTSASHIAERHDYFAQGGPLATFVAADTDGQLCGFAEASLRPSAEGCTTCPVGYLEGIFVRPAFRRQGIGRLLAAAVERWAASRGCAEFASDCHAGNEASLHFHRQLGFDIASQLLHFRRALGHPPGNA